MWVRVGCSELVMSVCIFRSSLSCYPPELYVLPARRGRRKTAFVLPCKQLGTRCSHTSHYLTYHIPPIHSTLAPPLPLPTSPSATSSPDTHACPSLERRRRWSVVGGVFLATMFIAVAVHVHSRNTPVALSAAAAPQQAKDASQLFRGSKLR